MRYLLADEHVKPAGVDAVAAEHLRLQQCDEILDSRAEVASDTEREKETFRKLKRGGNIMVLT